jgi:acetyl esterase/lipase
MRTLVILLLLATGIPASARPPDPVVERNVVFGMYSGLALLMDVYRPAKPNGAGVIAIQGSGWYSPLRYDAAPITARPGVIAYAQHFAQAGYTVFVINHRAAPRFRFPAQLEDAQRAVRFVRAHAAEWHVDPARIGAFGSSSGGHLAELLGTVDGAGDASSSDPTERESAKVRAVVALFAPADMVRQAQTSIRDAHVALMGFEYLDPAMRAPGSVRPDESENVEYRRASPSSWVTADDAPMLLMHGDADEVVVFEQSELMSAALQKAGVANELIRVPGGRHGDNFQLDPKDPRLPDQYGESIRWFDTYLK